ncbi:MAG: hypothetical protein WBJ51_03920, partial [Methanoculleus sp.]
VFTPPRSTLFATLFWRGEASPAVDVNTESEIPFVLYENRSTAETRATGDRVPPPTGGTIPHRYGAGGVTVVPLIHPWAYHRKGYLAKTCTLSSVVYYVFQS